jgi:hypothetical protein
MQTFRQPSKRALQVEEIAVRIAGVLAVYADETEITADLTSNGIALADWYLAKAVRLEDGASLSADVRKADKLRVWLIERWTADHVSISTIVQAGAAKIRSAKEARAIIPHLVSNNRLLNVTTQPGQMDSLDTLQLVQWCCENHQFSQPSIFAAWAATDATAEH